MTVAAILRHKNAETVTVTPETLLVDVATLLSQRRIGAAPVMEGDTLVGIISERDLVHCLARHGAHALDLTASQAMTRAVQTTRPEATVVDTMAAMTAGRFRHMPVMLDGRMIGVISIGDVVKARLDEQANEVDNLRAYVAGS
ncbi:CBS domain-containing protein [Acidisphaera sp. L21]|jgi:CBS domain-containing protein|uniref:CBS domain-containing protein n=1 Tax=Acidisphaera sp. L21 TaxID=1641851 RepID=UPI00131A7D00|nr:CBS domain-containing protein [Acidisphaera sp. L21]